MGKPEMVAIGALMRKRVHRCYGVLKTATVFCDLESRVALND